MSPFEFAQTEGYRVFLGSDVRQPDFAAQFEKTQIDLILTVRFPYILPAAVLALPVIGAFNLHTGPLPAYAGIDVISWAIYNGECRHGVTVHWMDERIDTGAIAYQHHFDIHDEDTVLTVTGTCVRTGLELMMMLLDTAARRPDAIPTIKQDLDHRHYYRSGQPNNGRIIWQQSAKRITDYIRASAYYPFPGSWRVANTSSDGAEFGIFEANLTLSNAQTGTPGQIIGVENNSVVVACGDSSITFTETLVGDEVKAAREWLTQGQILT